MKSQVENKNEHVYRVSLDNPDIPYETIQHHLERYKFATTIKTSGNYAIDLGCGTGYGTSILKQSGLDAIGIDNDAGVIEYAKTKYPDTEFAHADIADINLEGYSLITFFETMPKLVHLVGVGFITRIGKYMDKDAVFVMSVPRDARLDTNPRHKSEIKFEDLSFLLKKTFKHVKLLGQNWATGHIHAENPAIGDFYIAICSHCEIQVLV